MLSTDSAWETTFLSKTSARRKQYLSYPSDSNFFARSENQVCSSAVRTEMLSFPISQFSHLRKGTTPVPRLRGKDRAALALLTPNPPPDTVPSSLQGTWHSPVALLFYGERRSLAVLEMMTFSHKKVSSLFILSTSSILYQCINIFSHCSFLLVYSCKQRKNRSSKQRFLSWWSWTLSPQHSSKTTQPKVAPKLPRLLLLIPTYANTQL